MILVLHTHGITGMMRFEIFRRITSISSLKSKTTISFRGIMTSLTSKSKKSKEIFDQRIFKSIQTPAAMTFFHDATDFIFGISEINFVSARDSFHIQYLFYREQADENERLP